VPLESAQATLDQMWQQYPSRGIPAPPAV